MIDGECVTKSFEFSDSYTRKEEVAKLKTEIKRLREALENMKIKDGSHGKILNVDGYNAMIDKALRGE